MDINQLYNILAQPESENIEFKEAKNQFSILGKDKTNKKNKKSVYGYAVAIGNHGGGYLVFGVKDLIDKNIARRSIVGTNAIQNIAKAKKELYKVLNRKVEIFEINTEDGKVQVVRIPSHPVGGVFRFYGIPLMRNDDNLIEIDDETLRNILNERQNDFSAEIIANATMEDLDNDAINKIRENWIKKLKKENKNTESNLISSCSDKELLNKLGIVDNNFITHTALLLAGNEKSLAKILPNAEIIIEYRNDKNQTHYDFRTQWRKAFILSIPEIEEAINSRNQRLPFKQGFIEFDIWRFDLWSMREAINNAFAHRDYFNRTEPVIIKISPEYVQIKSPGGFISGVTVDNVLEVEGKWRNRLLMETMQRIGFVERAGIGLDRIFIENIKQGKGSPNFNNTNNEYVVLNIPTKIKDLNFVYYLEKLAREKQIFLDHVKDFLELEKIREQGNSTDKVRVNYFYKNGIIEKVGKGRGMKYLLSKNFYEFIEKRSEYTRKKWLNKDEQKQIILNYLKNYKKGKVSDFKKLFKEKELTNQQINRLLKELKDRGVYFEGPQRSKSAYWKIIK